MLRLFANANYDFIRWRRWAYGLTAAIIIPGFALFLVHGLNYSIEFTGGTLIQVRSEEHTSELQSQSNLVCRLLLEKKKKKKKDITKVFITRKRTLERYS